MTRPFTGGLQRVEVRGRVDELELGPSGNPTRQGDQIGSEIGDREPGRHRLESFGPLGVAPAGVVLAEDRINA